MPTIRTLRTDDRPRWEELFRGYMAFYERDEPPSMYDRAWDELTSDERMHALVAELDGHVVGLVHYLFHASTSTRDVCYLQDLFTDPTARGHGAGRALIEAVLGVARDREAERVYWQTQTSNATARRLYDAITSDRDFMVYRVPLPRRG